MVQQQSTVVSRLLAVLGTATVLWCGVAVAQPPGGFQAPPDGNQGPRPPQMPGGPGFGGPGFGGGFGGPGFGGSGMDSTLFLLRRQDVRKELEVDEDQLKQLTALEAKLGERMRGMFAPQMRDRNADNSRGQRRENAPPGFGQDFRAAFEQYNKEARSEVANILLPHQLKRLEQLANQLRLSGGAMAVFGGDVSRNLGITDQQREQLRTKAEEIERNTQKKIAEIRRQAQEELVTLLSAEQQTKYREMIGQPFEFQNEPMTPRGMPGQGGYPRQGGAPNQGGFPGQGGPGQPPPRNN